MKRVGGGGGGATDDSGGFCSLFQHGGKSLKWHQISSVVTEFCIFFSPSIRVTLTNVISK